MPHRLGTLAVLMLALYVLTTGGRVDARPEQTPGNSGNAKACQHGGYLLLTRPDGTGFATTGECVSFAAKGGDLVSKPESATSTSTPRPSTSTATHVPPTPTPVQPTATPTLPPPTSTKTPPTPTLAPPSLSEGCAALNDSQFDGEYDAGYGVGPTGLSFTAGEVISIDATALPSTQPGGNVYFLFTGAPFVRQPESGPALTFVVPTTGLADATWYFITDSDPYPVIWDVSCRAGS